MWGLTGYPFSNDYLTVLAENYGAGLQTIDFEADPEGSRELINDWVKDATEDRIQDLLPSGSIRNDTALVLVNAVWFKASWAQPFDEDRTYDGDFTLLDGSKVTVPLMQRGHSHYAETDDYQALRLPYVGDAAMVVLLPKTGATPAELATQMTTDDMNIEWRHFNVNTTLPKFTFDTDLNLASALQALGMNQAFSATANLDAITGSPNDLFVTGAFHKSFIAVDEKSTEAAAATGVVAGPTSAPPSVDFTADRPFMFWIEHDEAGVLFMGQVTDPS